MTIRVTGVAWAVCLECGRGRNNVFEFTTAQALITVLPCKFCRAFASWPAFGLR